MKYKSKKLLNIPNVVITGRDEDEEIFNWWDSLYTNALTAKILDIAAQSDDGSIALALASVKYAE